eukprot:CAMPEP_0168545962 /NCGR_PEP_ID=MMETSP0413-20121227/3245_1 /TAXON_ID=136452 /ORGANISM="Filamoeba nolandi, Strain NC-AS-23-1" /LENGTH=497 /DNA_ID=CAMNT_0008576109 /DNA_START=74 /DNA_END=1567 /DNA_ORIENTATION=-
MNSVLQATLALFTVICAIIVYNTATAPSRQLDLNVVGHRDQSEDIQIDKYDIAKKVSQAVQIPTISYEDRSLINLTQHLRLHHFLEHTFPLAHQKMEKIVIEQYSLIFKWPGKNQHKRPVMLAAHMDVVPIEPGTEVKWVHEPFAGTIADGFVWGRGTMDTKVSLIGIMQAIEHLISRGYQPERTFYLAFGSDEEISGYHGAFAIARYFQTHKITFDYILDEGLTILLPGFVPYLSGPAAMVGVTEKGFVSLRLEVESEGGHSSMPNPKVDSSVAILSKAISALEFNPFPASFAAAKTMSDYLVAEMPFLYRMIFANPWIFESPLCWVFAQEPASNAMIRTTTAVTIVVAGIKENVIPSKAHAIANFRIIPGETVDTVINNVITTINDPRVHVSLKSAESSLEPAPLSDIAAPEFHNLQKTIQQVFPGTLVAPSMMIGNTDTRHYWDLSKNIYRFTPQKMSKTDTARFHGVNERISVDSLWDIVNFYNHLIRNSDRL